MSPFIDFSDTAVWIAGAFVAGGLVFGLMRLLLGSADLPAAEVFSLIRQLDAASEQRDMSASELSKVRDNYESQASKATYYEKEFNRLFASWQRLSQDAGDLSRQRDELIAARGEIESQKSKAREHADKIEKDLQLKYDGELSRLRDDLIAARKEVEGQQSEAKEHATKIERDLQAKYDSEVARLNAELTAAQNSAGQATWLTSEVRRLTNEMSYAARDLQAGTEDKSRLEAEVAKLKSALASAYADLRSTLIELQTANRNLQKARNSADESSVPLRSFRSQGILDSRVCNLG